MLTPGPSQENAESDRLWKDFHRKDLSIPHHKIAALKVTNDNSNELPITDKKMDIPRYIVVPNASLARSTRQEERVNTPTNFTIRSRSLDVVVPPSAGPSVPERWSSGGMSSIDLHKPQRIPSEPRRCSYPTKNERWSSGAKPKVVLPMKPLAPPPRPTRASSKEGSLAC